MPLETSFRDLCAHLDTLGEALQSVHFTAVEDRPAHGDAVFVDLFGDAATDLLGWLQEARQAADEACRAAAYPSDLGRAWRCLTVCHDRYSRIAHHFHADLIHHRRIQELGRFGRQRGGEWRRWAASVRDGLDSCRHPLDDVDQALFVCWQEVGERVGLSSVAVHSTSIGQHIRLDAHRAVEQADRNHTL